MAATTTALGVKLEDSTLSYSLIRRARITQRKQIAEEIFQYNRSA